AGEPSGGSGCRERRTRLAHRIATLVPPGQRSRSRDPDPGRAVAV
ncbi:MAG: hypothetical protein AVDCRST_MAG49-4537, partial [uncultured Thermomicrobiales bacterium]